MQIVFLIAGLPLIAVGIAIIVSEAKARRDAEALQACVVGFSVGKSANPNMTSYHPVAEYVGPNGRKYYVEGSVGSSVPLRADQQVCSSCSFGSRPGLLFFSYHVYEGTQKFLDAADYVVGTVVELRQRDSSEGDRTYAAVVEYRDRRGTSLKFLDSFSLSPPYYRTGQTVSVLYSREDPNKAQIDRGLANYWLPALLGVLGALFLLMGLHSARRQFR